jgi:uncharacterized protein YndB with AHSA1/START domain
MSAKTEAARGAPTTDRIEKHVELRAPRSRVWRAIADASQFGTWFHVKLDGAFVEGATTRGQITERGYEHLKFEMEVQRIEPERYFAYRWHPYATDPQIDYSAEPTTLVTLVEFTLEETADGGTALTIVESGFDSIPLARRAEAYRMNDGGWSAQLKNIERYVA